MSGHSWSWVKEDFLFVCFVLLCFFFQLLSCALPLSLFWSWRRNPGFCLECAEDTTLHEAIPQPLLISKAPL